ncbi:nuclear matrix constituent protein 1-like protein [Dorcoceras hygrometricum]|uniref:Nuclear matrix constituent protein 1-like protein n=1 Tax=Dorcoceras hygrometricum TaxID=472368 RepID=A0A2Z7AP47_9LAMI|nr:nuclear matrix constituent protein 1-like protein [Dorcoceras hygrometricum]
MQNIAQPVVAQLMRCGSYPLCSLWLTDPSREMRYGSYPLSLTASSYAQGNKTGTATIDLRSRYKCVYAPSEISNTESYTKCKAYTAASIITHAQSKAVKQAQIRTSGLLCYNYYNRVPSNIDLTPAKPYTDTNSGTVTQKPRIGSYKLNPCLSYPSNTTEDSKQSTRLEKGDVLAHLTSFKQASKSSIKQSVLARGVQRYHSYFNRSYLPSAIGEDKTKSQNCLSDDRSSCSSSMNLKCKRELQNVAYFKPTEPFVNHDYMCIQLLSKDLREIAGLHRAQRILAGLPIEAPEASIAGDDVGSNILQLTWSSMAQSQIPALEFSTKKEQEQEVNRKLAQQDERIEEIVRTVENVDGTKGLPIEAPEASIAGDDVGSNILQLTWSSMAQSQIPALEFSTKKEQEQEVNRKLAQQDERIEEIVRTVENVDGTKLIASRGNWVLMNSIWIKGSTNNPTQLEDPSVNIAGTANTLGPDPTSEENNTGHQGHNPSLIQMVAFTANSDEDTRLSFLNSSESSRTSSQRMIISSPPDSPHANSKLEEVNKFVASIDSRMVYMESKLTSVDSMTLSIDSKMHSMESKLRSMNSHIEQLMDTQTFLKLDLGRHKNIIYDKVDKLDGNVTSPKPH